MLEYYTCHTFEDVARAIREMTVRGAPAIGAAAAFGLALAAQTAPAHDVAEFLLVIKNAAEVLRQARPTAVNLDWALRRIMTKIELLNCPVETLRKMILEEAQRIADEDIETNKRMAEIGAALIDDGDTIIHHCNTGALAVVDWGTALGVIRTAHDQGKKIHVLVDETRPRLQGARLTAWELTQYGISFEIICDNMAGTYLRSGEVTKVFFGADRIAANGDVANKIGTYMLALTAHANNVPVYCVAPVSTIDLSIANGSLIPIEERDPDEVLGIRFHNEPIAPTGSRARNPAFDISPNELISAIITEKAIIRPPYRTNLISVVSGKNNKRD